MTWLISKALMDSYEKWPSSQGLEEESSEDICMDGEPCAQSSGKPIQLAYLPPDKMTKFSRLSQFGMTFRPLTESRGEDLLTWYREDFLAKTYPQQERAQESPESAAVCGRTWQGSLAKYDPNTHSWRTAQCSLFEDLELSWETFPRWGMTRSGELYQQPVLAHHISVNESGLSLVPTPTSSTGGANHNSPSTLAGQHEINLAGAGQKWPTPTASDHKGSSDPMQAEKVLERGYNHNLSEAVAYSRKFPTPQATDHISKRTSASWKAKGGVNYSLSNPEIQMMWPTPRVLEVDESYENYISRMQKSGNPKNIGKTKPNNLTMAVNLWPTPNTLESLPPKKLERIMEHNQKARPGRSYASMNLRELVVYGTQPIWPTPTANEDACGKPTGKMQKMLGNHPEVRQDPNGGVLNADWVEWLMGWPIGWTKLEPLESFTEFDETWWDVEPVPRVLIGATARADRLKAIGNGQVPIVAATAWNILRKK